MHNLRSDHPLCLTWQRGRLRSAREAAGMVVVEIAFVALGWASSAAACRTPHTLRVKEEQSNKVQA
jgi:hypothetical protein